MNIRDKVYFFILIFQIAENWFKFQGTNINFIHRICATDQPRSAIFILFGQFPDRFIKRRACEIFAPNVTILVKNIVKRERCNII